MNFVEIGPTWSEDIPKSIEFKQEYNGIILFPK